MRKKILIPLLLLFGFIASTGYAQVDPNSSKLHIAATLGITDENGALLPGNNPARQTNTTYGPYVPGAVVQLISVGADNIANPPSETGGVTGDDVLLSTHAIGEGVNILYTVSGKFDFILVGADIPAGYVYIRIFNKSSLAEATYYGQATPVSYSTLAGNLDRYYYVNLNGLTTTDQMLSQNTSPVANAGGPYTIDEGSTIQLDAGATTDPDDQIGDLTFEWDLDCDGQFDDASGVNPTTAVWPDNVTRTIAVKVTDPDDNISYASASVVVNNVAPTVDDITDKNISEGDLVSIIVSYSDLGSLDTHTATMDWGDGNIVPDFDIQNNSINLEHQYTDFNIYTAKLTVTDKDGGFVEKVFQVNVARVPINLTATLEDNKDITLEWNVVAGKEYEIMYSDSSFEKFGTADMNWHLAGVSSTGLFVDQGDADGYDNIQGTADDRLHPKDAVVRYYRIVLAGSVNAGSPWASENIVYYRNIKLYTGRNFVGNKCDSLKLSETLDGRFLPGSDMPSTATIVDFWQGTVQRTAYLADYNNTWFDLMGSPLTNDDISVGSGFIVTIPPNAVSPITLPMVGIVNAQDSVDITVNTNDYTTVSLPYEGEVMLDQSGLLECGFRSDSTSRKADKIYFFNPETQRYDLVVFHYISTNGSIKEWRYMDQTVCNRKIKAGEAFLIKTNTTTLLTHWIVNRPYPKSNSNMNK